MSEENAGEGTAAATVAATAEEAAAAAANKRYAALSTVKNKAIKGKGAWYWAHLEPLLIHDPESRLPKSVKLRCTLCLSLFSASNPSRTASEHLKRGTCANFVSSPSPICSVSPNNHHHRKRALDGGGGSGTGTGGGYDVAAGSNVSPLSIIDPSKCFPETGVGYSHGMTMSRHPHQLEQQQQINQQQQQNQSNYQLVLSGGKEDLGALAMLEDSVKRLKSPKTSPGPALSKTQTSSAFESLADWVYESCGSVSLSSLEHPKFRVFLTQVGLPGLSRRELVGSRMDARYEDAKREAEARIRDAMFFQVSSDGWRVISSSKESVVNLTVNLPNRTSVYRKAVFVGGQVPSKYAEEVLWETIMETCGDAVQRCVGIVSDRFKNKALRSLESRNQWMINLVCQCRGFESLIKDFYRELPLFKNVADNCIKLGNFVNSKCQIRNSFFKYQLRDDGHSSLLRLPVKGPDASCFEPVFVLIGDILSSSRALQSILLDESYKIAAIEDQVAREYGDMMRDAGFWNDLEAVHSLVKLVKEIVHEMESERPLVGQCLPLWEEFRSKMREWCAKFHVSEALAEKVIDRRFKKNYHPAWAAAYILDPLYLIRDTSGKYLPPFKYLTHQQEKDVDKLITRLVSTEEAHIALMELMKWRTEGLDPVYAQAVQLKQRDPVTGKMRIANPQSSRLVWETYLSEFKSLGKVAVRLIFLHATSRGFKSNSSFLRCVETLGHSRVALGRAQKLIFIAAHSKLERRDFTNDDDKDAEFFALPNGEDDLLNEVFVDASSM